MLSHEFVYPRVTPLPGRSADDAPTPHGRRVSQRDLVMASVIRRPAPVRTSRDARTAT